MSRVTTAYVSAYQRDRVHHSRFYRFEKCTLVANFNGVLRPGVTVRCVEWDCANPDVTVMADASCTSTEGAVSIVASIAGRSALKCTAEMTDGRYITQLFSVDSCAAPYFQTETFPSSGAAHLHACAQVIANVTVSGALGNAALGGAADYTYTASGGTPPYVFSQPEGALPTGLEMSPEGNVTGTFTQKDTFFWSVQAVDSVGNIGTLLDTSLVADMILAGDLPPGNLNDAVSYPYVVSGGTGPYTYTISSGSLPDGVTLDEDTGVISGSFTSVGPFSWTITATDSASATAHVDDSTVVSTAVPSQSSWRYKQISHSDNTDYSAKAFDDSAWSIGAAPFGQNSDGVPYDQAIAAHNYDHRFSSAYDDAPQGATLWQTGTRLWMRKTITLAAVPTADFHGVFYMDDTITMWINGTKILGPSSFGHGGGGGTATIPTSSLVVGENIIAVKCDDEGPWSGRYGEVYVDMVLELAP